MTDMPIITTRCGEPSAETLAYECKFTVESRRDGNFECNLGGPHKRVTFDGYASAELMSTIADAVGKVVSE